MQETLTVKIVHLDPIRVAYLRHIGPYPECGPVFQKLCAWASERGLHKPGKRKIGASWDDPSVVPAAQLRYDCCLEVDPGFRPADEILVQTLAGGDYACYRHVGEYSGIGPAFHRLFAEWLPASGRQARRGACLEIYGEQDHAATPPEELITDILIPLQ